MKSHCTDMRRGVATALLGGVLSSLAFAQIPFAAGVPLAGLIEGPRYVRSGDVDGDGIADVVVLSSDGAFSLLGTPSGGFRPAASLFEVSGSTFGLDLSDLDGDGDLEVLVFGLGDVSVWTRLSDGSYGLTQTLANVRCLQVADLDADGRNDLISFGPQGGNLVWRRGLGALSFGAPAPLIPTSSGVTEFAVADLTGDGDLDLVVSSVLGSFPGLWAFEGSGVIPFALSLAVDIGASVPADALGGALSVFDGDGDGDQDVVTSNDSASGTVRYVANAGGGVFVPSAPLTSARPTALAVADADGDGSVDLAIRPWDPNLGQVVIRRGDGAGGFLAEEWIGTPSARALDLEFRDIAAGAGAEVLTADEEGAIELTAWTGTEFGAPLQLQDKQLDVAVADFAGQGDTDLVVLSVLPRRILRRRRGLDGQLGASEVVAGNSVPGSSSPVSVDIGDIDGDGRDDLVFVWLDATASASRVAARFGLDGGDLGPVIQLVSNLGGAAEGLKLVDLDNDGALDMVAWNPFGSSSIVTARNQGDGTFVSGGWLGGTTQANFLDPLIVDADGDGVVDVVLRFLQTLQWFRGLGDGTFAPRAEFYSVPLDLERSAITDVDGDGAPDLVWVRELGLSSELRWARGLGAGQYAPPAVLLPNAPYRSPQFVDLDRDGLEDLVATRGMDLVVRKRLSALTFGSETQIAFPSAAPFDLVLRPKLIDLDGDEDLDLGLYALSVATSNLAWFAAENLTLSEVGAEYCAAGPLNSTGARGRIGAYGSRRVQLDALQLRASALPPASTGFFLTSRMQGLVTSVPNSVGTLCLGGSIGRFVGRGQVGTTDAGGTLALDVDLTRMPTPSLGLVAALPGQTWYFQAWHRDSASGQATSNFTSGLGVTFL